MLKARTAKLVEQEGEGREREGRRMNSVGRREKGSVEEGEGGRGRERREEK